MNCEGNMGTACQFNQQFDLNTMQQYVNFEPSVMHCHHYATLFTKLALDTLDLGGPSQLAYAMEDSFYLIFKKYFIAQHITTQMEKKEIIEQYFGLVGLGELSITITADGGQAEMRHSHVDEGWVKKWGKHDQPVNFMGQGFLMAAFDVLTDRKLRSFTVKETQSIVKGDQLSRFVITKRNGV